jgi:hypothetical protein
MAALLGLVLGVLWSGEFSNNHGANRSSLPGLREGGRTGNDMPSENESVCL